MHLNILLTYLKTKSEFQNDNIAKEAKIKNNSFKVILLENSHRVFTGCAYLYVLHIYIPLVNKGPQ